MRLLFPDTSVPVSGGIGAFVSQLMRAVFITSYAVDELRVEASFGSDLGAQRAQAGGGESDLENLPTPCTSFECAAAGSKRR